MAIPIYFGARSFGRIDDGEGGHRATRFFHIYYLPLIPLGGVYEDAGGRARAAPLLLRSLLLSYFKWIGFVGAVGLAALAYNDLERPSETAGFVLGAAAIFLAAAVVASWSWIGNRAATLRTRFWALAVPLIMLLGPFGWALKERQHRQSLPSYVFAERRVAYQAAHPGTSDLDYLFHQLQQVVDSERSAPPLKDCAGAHFITGRFEGRDLLGADGEQLARLAGHQPLDSSKEWLVSRPLLELVGSYPEGALYSISERPYLAVLSGGEVRIHDLIEGTYLCGARFSSGGRGGEFLKPIAAAVQKITRDVYFDYNLSAGTL